ncbi:hypothetical protein D9Q98_001565 [Chlorella vulgaris]|uniref:Vesicle transport protein USE1 n=1 Tax=Chlorella vulgaris TaxID=3077 RepID=A0A9D4TUT7_CHLVU|nr:hypothetical protein D9Q98_001565 [Chlorella vulgaris]
MDTLPSPTSGLFLETSFRRLLASCEDIVGGTSVGRSDLIGNWKHSPVFHHYVETLQEQLSDLETSAGSRVPRQLMQQYNAHVEALANQLEKAEVPAYCTITRASVALPQQQQQQQRSPAVAGGAPAAMAPPVAVARTPQLPSRPAARLPPEPDIRRDAARKSDGGGRLQTQQQLHEDLTEELAGLAAQLKSSTQAIEGKLKERGQLLDGTEAALDTSLQKTRESKDKAAAVHKRGRANFCLTCLVMLIIGLLFAGMYLFIKMTRLAGYRAAAPMQPPAALPPPQSEPPPPHSSHGVPVYEQHYDL